MPRLQKPYRIGRGNPTACVALGSARSELWSPDGAACTSSGKTAAHPCPVPVDDLGHAGPEMTAPCGGGER